MIPRGELYISWMDLAAGAAFCLSPQQPARLQRRVEQLWGLHTVACLSVRTGLDAVLQAAELPPGSEVIVSSITIPHILDILASHHLEAVPVNVDLKTLSIDEGDVCRAISIRTKAILIAHLFGSRMPLDAIASLAEAHDLMLIEDCAQAYDGSEFRGHPRSTVSMFSFGTIKRQTALGGGLLRFRDSSLAEKVRDLQAKYERQSRLSYLRRVVRAMGIRVLTEPQIFGIFVKVCHYTGRSHDQVIGEALRGFKHGNLLTRIRLQPSAPLLKLLSRRLKENSRSAIARSMKIVNTIVDENPTLTRPGCAAMHHTHWLFPILTCEPERLLLFLWTQGFDATRGASNLTCVPGSDRQFLNQVVYLPLYPRASNTDLRHMARVIGRFEGKNL